MAEPVIIRKRKPAVAAAPAVPAVPATGPRFTVVSRDNETLVFDVEGISVTLANAIRRTIMENVESVAFKGHPSTEADIKITANSSAIINEEIMERMSLIPIHVSEPWKFDPAVYEFRIDVTNTDQENGLNVTSADIEVRKIGQTDWHKAEEFFKPSRLTGDYVLLTRLPPATLTGINTQQLALTATASVGTGMTHASYIPAIVTYEYVMEDESTAVGRDRLQAAFDKWIRDGKKTNMLATDEGQRAAKAEFDSMERQRVYKINAAGEPAMFRFTVESIGPIGPAAIVAHALDLLVERLRQFAGVAGETELPEVFAVSPCSTGMNGIDIHIQEETHTLGALLQFYLAKHFTEIASIDSTRGRPLSFAGYKVPHPLETSILVRLGVSDNEDPRSRCLKAFADCISLLVDELTDLKGRFVASVSL